MLLESALSSPQELDRFLAGVERRAYRMAVIATGNRDEALDIVQDTMMKLAQKYGDRDPGQWGPLFHRILQNTILDWHRRRQVRKPWMILSGFFGTVQHKGHDNLDSGERGTSLVEQIPCDEASSPGARLSHERTLQALEKALNRLPLRQQQAFLLRAWEGMNVMETARAMNCSQGSVKTHYSRAVHALREQLEDYR